MKLLKCTIVGLVIICLSNFGISQALICDDAVILSSLEELDGFEASMPASNPNDEPAPFCPGASGGTGNPQNMSWLAFIASSTDATIEITFSNCINGSSIQYGLYTDCTFTEYIDGVCQGDAVSANSPVVVNMSGMIVGEDYFLFIDGDLGAYCEYVIEVICSDEIATIPQPSNVDCISINCPIDGLVCTTGETFIFEPAGLDLEIDYIWTVTPSPPDGLTITDNNEFSATFDSTGVYEICVVGNNGCTETMPVCYSLNVVEPEAGVLTSESDTLCIEEVTEVISTGFFVGNPMSTWMIAVSPDGKVINTEWGTSIDVTYYEIGIVKVYSYNFNNNVSPDVPDIGATYMTPNCSEFCCDLDSIDIVFVDNKITSVSNSINDNSLQVQVYPNPTKRTLKVEFKNAQSNVMDLSILDPSGKKVKTSKFNIDSNETIELDLINLPIGLYHLVMNFGDEAINKKIVKVE